MSWSLPRSSSAAGRTVTLAFLSCMHPVYSGRSGRENCGMDRIVLEGMSFSGRHGVRPAEREHAQDFEVDVEMEADLAGPGSTDRIEDTVDYRAARAIAKQTIEGESVKLLETLAARIADPVLTLPRVTAVSVRVAKRPPSLVPVTSAPVPIGRTRAWR